MFFSWLKKRRRQRILAQPSPDSWPELLERFFAPYALLSEEEQARLGDDMRIFIAEKEWEGCGGLEVSEEMRVTVAAHACRLVLGLSIDYFRQVQTILLYPAGYQAPEQVPLGDGVVLEGRSERLGEAHYRGPVILSWQEVEEAACNPGRGENLVYHEFAHQIDMLNGAIDGVPPLEDEELARRWLRVMPAELDRLRRDAAAGRPTLLDTYGAKDESEFFAVTTECFFDCPALLFERHPQLYRLWQEFFRQDPAKSSNALRR